MSTSFTKIVQGSGEAFTEFLQRLVSAVNRATADTEARQVLIEAVVLGNVSTECRRSHRAVKGRAVPMDQ